MIMLKSTHDRVVKYLLSRLEEENKVKFRMWQELKRNWILWNGREFYKS